MTQHRGGTRHYEPGNVPATLMWLAAALVLLSGTAALADADGTAGSAFLKLGAGARAAAMGGTYVGIADDVYAARWNPAGLAQLTSAQVAAQHLSEFGGLTHQYVAAAIPYGRHLTFGMDLIATQVEDNYRTELTDLGAFSNRDMAFGLSAAWAVQPRLALGITGRYLSEHLADITAQGWSVDLGLMYRPVRHWSFGLAALNLGPPLTFSSQSDKLPTVVKGGLAYHWTPDLLLAADVSFPNDASTYFSGGIEYQLTHYVAVRTGYEVGTGFRGMDAVSGGVAFNYQGFTVDYAFVPRAELGNIHRLGLRVAFDGFGLRDNPLLPPEPSLVPVVAPATRPPATPARTPLTTLTPLPRPRPAPAATPVPPPVSVAVSRPPAPPVVVPPLPEEAVAQESLPPMGHGQSGLPSTYAELYRLGCERLAAGDYPDAIIVLDAANQMQFDNFEAHYAQAVAFHLFGDNANSMHELDLARRFLR